MYILFIAWHFHIYKSMRNISIFSLFNYVFFISGEGYLYIGRDPTLDNIRHHKYVERQSEMCKFPTSDTLNQIGGLFKDIYIDITLKAWAACKSSHRGEAGCWKKMESPLNFFPPFLPCSISNLLVKANLTLFIQTVYFLS